MQLDSTEELVQTLRASGLFTPEQFLVVARDLSTFGGDLKRGIRHLLKREHVTHYQLGKVLRGKSAELIVGPYIVLDKLGEGGMGKVFRAWHSRRERLVALKVVRPSQVSNPVVRGRYAREVEVTGKLNHPNIVRVEDAGEANGTFYLAMEFVDGIDLARMMRDYRRLAIIEACEYTRQAALGLQHAHEVGIVHRDVKPSNIVVAGERHLPQATGPSLVKILDLGLARAIGPDDMLVPGLTRDHNVVGTPDYMAPEQAKHSKSVGAHADLYSLGCTLYFLLTGQTPFPTGNAIEKLMAHQHEQPSPLQALRPEVPAAVAELVARLMAKKPYDRFATAAELAVALEPHARYPDGSVKVPLARDRGRDTAPPSETVPPGRTVSADDNGLSIGPGPFLIIPPVPVPVPQRVAPSYDTPRPPGLEEAFPVIEPGTEHASTKRHPPPRRTSPRPAPVTSHEPHALKWGLIVVAVAILVALGVWAVTLVLAPAPTQPDPDTRTKPPVATTPS